jgi:two-component system, NarL family, sensor histidine kinase BarA
MKPVGKILIVDDEPSSITLLVRLLQPYYRLAVAKDGEEGLRIAAGEDPPDLILLDVIMPGQDGYATCRGLKANPATREIPVIFLTIKSEVEAETLGLELGAVDYIAKPVSPPILLARVRTHLSLHRMQRDLETQVHLRTAELLAERAALQQSEQELRRAMEQAEAAGRAKGTFLSVMSHEMRTPLHAILGMNQLMDNCVLSPNGRDYLSLQRKAIRGLTTLIDDILTLTDLGTRATVGEPAPEPEHFDLRGVLETINDVLGQEAADKGLRMQLALDPAITPWRKGDARRLRQVLLALAGNAIKFTQQGEVRIQVGESAQGELRVAVSDTGIGIPPEWRQRIFEPFTQVDSSIARRYNGSGLGLSLARRMAEYMGGEIAVESSPGRGSTFLLTAPLPAVPAT